MRLLSIAVFGAGYVLGTRAGRERYEQIVAAARKAPEECEHIIATAKTVSQRLEEYGSGGRWSPTYDVRDFRTTDRQP